MAAPQDPLLHMEAVEALANKKEGTNATWIGRVESLRNGVLAQSLLAYGEITERSYLKQKTRTSRILQYPRQVRVSASNLRLNRRIPNGTYGGVGGRSPIGLLLPD